jgi:O-methyltransferase
MIRMLNTDVLHSVAASNPWNQLYDEAIQRSQQGRFDNLNKRLRFYNLCQLAQIALTRHPQLDIAECGCWLGQSTYMLAFIMKHSASPGTLWSFDSFEGLSPFGTEDISPFWTTDDQRQSIREHFRSSHEHVSRVVAPFGCVRLLQGWIPEVFCQWEPRQLGFVSIDVDLHEPTRAAAETLYPHLAAGGIMYFDDYGYEDFPGARTAVDRFVEAVRPSFFIESPVGSAYLIK